MIFISKPLQVDDCSLYYGPLRKRRKVFLMEIDARHLKGFMKGCGLLPGHPASSEPT